MQLSKSSHFIENHTINRRLHLKHYAGQGDVVFMVHGAVENGGIFYSISDKGLAPFLARQGFDVYILDLQGRGQSTPAINKQTRHGQTESICIEIPAALDFINTRRPGCRQHWIAHSWGGVLLNSVLARQPERISQVTSQIYFGSKRFIGVRSWRKYIYINAVWFKVCRVLIQKYGFLPAKQFKLGSDSESNKSHRQCVEWVKGPWIDSDDGFDYGAAIAPLALPRTWYIAAINDHVLGHPSDVRRFMRESGVGQKRYSLLSKQSGNKHDYDHINMLTHSDAVDDHFPTILDWLGG